MASLALPKGKENVKSSLISKSYVDVCFQSLCYGKANRVLSVTSFFFFKSSHLTLVKKTRSVFAKVESSFC